MRPVFKRDSQQGTGTPQPGTNQNQAQQPQSNSTIPPAPSDQGMSVSAPARAATPQNRGNGTPPPHPTSTTSTPPPRALRNTGIFSGSGIFQERTNTPTTPTQPSSTAASPAKILHIDDQYTLEMLWRKVASNLKSVDKVVATRMESIVPTLKDGTTIEIGVANQNVEGFFKENKGIIIDGFKKELGEGQLDIQLRQVESSGPQKILSSYEQLEKMSEQNPSLRKLKDVLGLAIK